MGEGVKDLYEHFTAYNALIIPLILTPFYTYAIDKLLKNIAKEHDFVRHQFSLVATKIALVFKQ